MTSSVASAPQGDTIELDKFIARVDFYESCIDQLKREFPKYLSRQHELDKPHKHLAKTLRGVASSEPNQKLRDVIFLYSQKHDAFEKEREIFASCEKVTSEMAEEARKMLILPVKDIIADQKTVAKLAASAPVGTTRSVKSFKNDVTDAEFVQSTLQIHARMFEKHRLRSMKALLRALLTAELRYHCRVVEEISGVLHELALVEEVD